MSTQDVDVGVDINAGAGVVWEILSDFDNWDDWHGTGTEVSKNNELPKKLIFRAGPLPIAINLFDVKVVDEKSIEWTGALPFSRSLLHGKRKLILEETSKDACRFKQEESFFGLISPLLRKSLSALYRKNYSRFNENIKSIAESRSNR